MPRRRLAAAAALVLAACAASEDPLPSAAAVPAPEADCLRSGPGFDPSLVCRLSVAEISTAEALEALADLEMAAVREGDELTLFARYEGGGAVRLCCSLQSEMDRLEDSGVWAARYRLAELDRAMLTFIPPSMLMGGAIRRDGFFVWRGPAAPAAPARVEPGDLQGQVIDRTLWSEQLQETRRLAVYLPPGHDPSRHYPALFRADGPGDLGIIEALILSGAIPPIVVVGMASDQEGIVEDRSALAAGLSLDIRSADYLRPDDEGRGGERFDAHMRFAADEVVAMAVAEYAVSPEAADHIAQGSSNGGSFALWAGLLRPDVFGTALPMSFGWEPVTPEQAEAAFAAAGGRPARFLMSAGLYEPGFLLSMSQSADALAEAGFDVRFERVAAGHMSDQWELYTVRGLVEVLGPEG